MFDCPNTQIGDPDLKTWEFFGVVFFSYKKNILFNGIDGQLK